MIISPILASLLFLVKLPVIIPLNNPTTEFIAPAIDLTAFAILIFATKFPITAAKRVIVRIKGTSDEATPLRAFVSIRERTAKDAARIAKAFPSFIAASPTAFAFETKVSPVSFFEKALNSSPAPLRTSPSPFNGEVIRFITITTVPTTVANVPPIAIPIPVIPILIVLQSLSKADVVFSTDPLTASPTLSKIFVFIQL